MFAQVYRYLRAHFFYYFTSRPEQGKVHTEKGLRLQLTYHAGEDFLDIIDGLRAIDEAIIFCGLERGCRIGHALALGINPQDYYEYKNQKIILTKQVLLDEMCIRDRYIIFLMLYWHIYIKDIVKKPVKRMMICLLYTSRCV